MTEARSKTLTVIAQSNYGFDGETVAKRDEGFLESPPLLVHQVSLPITAVIIPGIAKLLKKWLPPHDRWLPICEGRYRSLTSEECWESSPRSAVAECIVGQLGSDLLIATSTSVYKWPHPQLSCPILRRQLRHNEEIKIGRGSQLKLPLGFFFPNERKHVLDDIEHDD